MKVPLAVDDPVGGGGGADDRLEEGQLVDLAGLAVDLEDAGAVLVPAGSDHDVVGLGGAGSDLVAVGTRVSNQ